MTGVRMKTSPLTLLAITAFAVLAFHGCSGKEAPNGQAKGAQAKEAQAIKITTAAIEGRSVERTAGWDEVIVSNEASGTVREIRKDLGDRVRKGDVLAVLDQREARLSLDQARAAHQTALKALEREKATLEEAKTIHRRYEELFKREMVSASQYDDVKTKLEVASSQFNQAESGIEEAAAKLALAGKRLADTIIKSPIDATVSRRAISAGEYLKDKTDAFTVVSTATLKFKGTVAEASAPMVAIGQEVRINVEAFKDKVFSGKLTRISPAVDVRTRTLELEASVPNAKGALKPGFFARGVISTHREGNVAFVPESAVYSFIGINKVFVIENGVAREKTVQVGAKDGGMLEVKGEALKPGLKVAASNLPNLFDGAKVAKED